MSSTLDDSPLPRPRRLASSACLLVIAVLSFTSGAAEPAAPAPPRAPSFTQDVRPILQAHCVKCHGPDKKKGDVDLAAFADDRAAAKPHKLWRKAAEQVEILEMPPEKEKSLTDADRATLLAWMKNVGAAVDCTDPAERDPGPALLRRLNRAEYDLTIRDLVGLPFDAGQAVGMPEDLQTVGFSNSVNGLILPPALMDKYFAAADQILEKVLSGEPKALAALKVDGNKKKAIKAAHDAIFFAAPAGDTPAAKRDAARQIVERFARRAYRRPVRSDEVDRLLTLFDRLDKDGKPFAQAVALSLKAVLVSPNFLFRIEQDRDSQNLPPQGYPVGQYELATRLSYFLWSSMPDEPLFALAEQGKLSDPAVLGQQVRRMLADPKAKALTDQFAAQWLQLAKLEVARPSTEFFPTFKQPLRQAMSEEVAQFFDHLRTEDRSVLELLDADYTYANAELAKHYDLPPIEGKDAKETRKVALPATAHRGGLLGMGAVLAMTSHTSRTSPTLRGKYVLEVVFGTPPAPPPPDAGQLKEEKAQKGKEPKTFREQMAQHAANPTCASCHKKIDPLGYALENFDAIGHYRTDAGAGRPLDSAGQLPTGEKFQGPEGLKQIVLARKTDFERNMAERLLTYALGRDLQYYDECAIKETTDRLARDGHRFSAMVLGIVNSHPFRHRKNADPTTTKD